VRSNNNRSEIRSAYAENKGETETSQCAEAAPRIAESSSVIDPCVDTLSVKQKNYAMDVRPSLRFHIAVTSASISSLVL
jgi:hypothetical protein